MTAGAATSTPATSLAFPAFTDLPDTGRSRNDAPEPPDPVILRCQYMQAEIGEPGMRGTHQMTDTGRFSAAPAEAGADYQNTTRVTASPGVLFEALTTVSGLAAWWVPRVTGSGDTGSELRFYMNSPEPLVIHVDQATWPTSVQWTVTDCPFLPDWVGTRPAFTITPVEGDAAELHFRHHGLTPELDCIQMCTSSWNHFLVSLRDYVEAGHGMPIGSSEDNARRRMSGDVGQRRG